MSPSELTSTTEDYLKVIWALNEWNDHPVTIGVLARSLSLAPSSVSETIKRLATQGLVIHEPYRGIRLSEDGESAAVTMIRRHRILETYLVRVFGYTWDEVHDEAENLEHGASERLIDAMAAALGDPCVDPHGDPIPRADGTIPCAGDAISLATLSPGSDAIVVRVSDAAPELLRWCDKAGLTLGAKVRVEQVISSAQLIEVAIADAPETVTLSLAAAGSVWVRP
ncbi:hypothetical protein BSZ39_08905 [Bowdeniella nasicola]|uniref:Manganese transport regulator n=1 Tax=Bowdeniella nasicola TaxID=208480 RepID=A0A1Q5Q122_9ACTO|nr:metal-dependent transcriptional regulator [Bowdeniella nasicola]OKL53548.1 hypothetical protein BSZ39_08905 [Bowdeniella nasicola]